MTEITLTDLSAETGLSVSHLGHLIARGILPEGRKDGKQRYLPLTETKLILDSHEKNKTWKPVKKPKLNWQDLL